jgi:hypothetical protein
MREIRCVFLHLSDWDGACGESGKMRRPPPQPSPQGGGSILADSLREAINITRCIKSPSPLRGGVRGGGLRIPPIGVC